MNATVPRLEPLSTQECLSLLRSVEIGRIGLWDGAPMVIPVCFVLQDDAIIIRTSAKSRLAGRGIGATIAFEVDDVTAGLRSGWSVMVTGRGERLVDEEELPKVALELLAWSAGERECFLRIPITEISGRRIIPVDAMAETGS